MINLPEPPEGILDPQNPWHLPMPKSPGLWGTLKARLTGRPNEYGDYSSYVNITEADADRLIANMKKDPRGYPQLDQSTGTPSQWMDRQRIYQEWLVEEYLEKPFREETDKKIEEAAIERRLNEIQEEKKKKVEQAVELTTEVVEETVLEEPDVPMVVPTTELIPSPKKPQQEEQKPEKTRKKRSSLLGSMLKTFTRMENHFQKLIELTESSEADMVVISDAFKIQSDTLTRGFQETTTLVTRVSQAVDLQSSTMVRIAKGKKDLDQKRLDAQEALNEEVALEQQQSSSGNAKAEDIGKGSGPGGGVGGSIAKVLGGAVIGKVLAGQGLKLAKGVGGKAASKISGKVLEKALGKETAETVLKNAGREAAETGIEKGAAKLIGKRIPLVGLGIGTFLALERAAKGDFLGAGLELASGAASTIPGGGTAASLGIDAALMARDSGMLPFEKGGLTQKSTFSTKRPGVTDLSPDLFKKMYQYEIDYEARNKIKFGRLYAEGYQKYFDSPGLLGRIGGFLGGLIEFFKNIANTIGNGIRNGVRGLNDLLNPRTGTTTNQFKDVLPEGNPQLTSRFGPRKVSWGSKNHQGIDIGVDRGSRVLSLEDGVVSNIMRSFGGHGDAVVVDHGDGTKNVYGHVDASVKQGDKIKKGQQIATVKYWPGSGAQPGDNTHLHLERRVGGGSYKAIDPAKYLNDRAGVSDPQVPVSRSAGEYDVVIPLDHVPPNLSGKFPDDNAKTSFKQSQATGADGRERQHQDKAAAKLKAKLEAGGLRVLIMKPESFKSYQDYDANIKAHAAKGTRILPLHFDASRSGGGTGFLTRTRAGDSADAAFAAPIQQALANFQKNNKQLGNLSKDTASNATVNAGAASPTALVELGVMVDWEKKVGSNFTDSDKFNQLIKALSDAILKTTKPRRRKPTDPARTKADLIGSGARASTNTQMDQLVAMAPLEEQMAGVQVIRVNRTTPVPISTSSDNPNDDTSPSGDVLKDIYLASIS